jgi:hypothetical protein
MIVVASLVDADAEPLLEDVTVVLDPSVPFPLSVALSPLGETRGPHAIASATQPTQLRTRRS